jgi:2-amino-4-hydroxy-6-hydroxymethyldihydropteridine diphosphokinase
MNKLVLINLGSNVDKEKNLPRAVRILRKLCRVLAVSTAYETVAIDTVARPNFLNAAVLIETPLDPAIFKRKVLRELEARLDRARTPDKNAPRTIDADITLYDQDVFDLDADHHIPDPDLRRFLHVAVPAAEIAPDLPHPETGETLAALADRLRRKTTAGGSSLLWKRPDVVLQMADHENPS